MFGDPTVTFHPRIYQFLQAASTYAKLKTNTNFKLKFEARKSSTMTMHGTIAKTNDLESLFSPTNLFTTFGQPETEFTSYDIDFTTTDYTSASSPLVLQFRALAANSTSGSFEIRNVSISEVLHDPGKPPGYISNESNILLGNVTKAKKSSIYYRAKEPTNIQLHSKKT